MKRKSLIILLGVLLVACNTFASVQDDEAAANHERQLYEKNWNNDEIKPIDNYQINQLLRESKDIQMLSDDKLSLYAFNNSGYSTDPKDLNPLKGTVWSFFYSIGSSSYEDTVIFGDEVEISDDGSALLPCFDQFGNFGIAVYKTKPMVPNPYVSGNVFLVYIQGTYLQMNYEFKINSSGAGGTGYYMHATYDYDFSNTYFLLAFKTSGPVIEKKTVYRFYKPAKGVHFYTASESEKNNVQNNMSNYTFEGPNFQVPKNETTSTKPVYRFYNTSNGVHFYTISETEKNRVQSDLPQFNFEGVAYYAFPRKAEGTTALFRFYNSSTGAHFYTISEQEKNNVINNNPNFNFEGTAYYVFPK